METSQFQIAAPKRAVSDSELVIRTLYEITSAQSQGFERQLEMLLELGCQRFDVEIGILSRVTDTRYEVLRVVAPDPFDLASRTSFDLAETYCSLTLEANGPVGFEHASATEIVRHPAFQAFRLEAYIGAPVIVGEEIFGTLNFSSPLPRQRKFEASDVDCLQLMSTWVATEIDRRRTEHALREATGELKRLSTIDPLTELLNRRGIEERLALLTARMGRGDIGVAAVLIDLDDFKHLNENHGLSAGDAVLVRVSRLILDTVRADDLVARIGGDEFLVVLPHSPKSEGALVAERLRVVISEASVSVAGADLTITASLGLAQIGPDERSVTSILQQTETKLRDSKRAGKNRVSE